MNTDFRVNGPVVTEPVARLETARNWRQFQRCERTRQWCIRAAWAALSALTLLIWRVG